MLKQNKLSKARRNKNNDVRKHFYLFTFGGAFASCNYLLRHTTKYIADAFETQWAGEGETFSFSCASHHIPQIFYRVTVPEFLHGKSQLFAVGRLSMLLTVALAKICGKLAVNFTRSCIIYLDDVINSQWIFLFILQFSITHSTREEENKNGFVNGKHILHLMLNIYHRLQVIIYSENWSLTVDGVQWRELFVSFVQLLLGIDAEAENIITSIVWRLDHQRQSVFGFSYA